MKYQRLQISPLPSRSQGGTLMGILIGIILGAAIVAGAAWFFSDNPFAQSSKSSTPAPATPNAAEQPAAQPVPALPGRPGGRPSERQDFSFFNNLPNDEGANQTRPPPAPAPVPAASAKQWFLQLAAFEKAEEADNLKAQLLLMGIAPVTQRAQLPDGRVVHRIRVGPFNDREDLKAMRSRLVAGGFAADEVSN